MKINPLIDPRSRSTPSDAVRRTIEYFEYPNRYFSKADTRLYLQPLPTTDVQFPPVVELDELGALTYTVQENLTPVYSYDTYGVHSWMEGNRIIAGQLGVYYVENGYLFKLLQPEGENSESVPFQRAPIVLTDDQIEEARSVIQEDLTFRFGVSPTSESLKNSLWRTGTKNELVEDDQSNKFRPLMQHIEFNIEIRHGLADNYVIASHETADRAIDGATGLGALQPDLARDAVATYRKKAKIQSKKLLGVRVFEVRIIYDENDRPLMELYSWMARDIKGMIVGRS